MCLFVQSVLPKCVANYKQLCERAVDVSVDKRNWLKKDTYVNTTLLPNYIIRICSFNY